MRRQPHPIIQHPYVSNRPILAPLKSHTYHSELLEWPGLFNVLQCLLKILQFLVYNTLGLLGILDGLSLKGLDCFDLPADIVGYGLEGLETVLDFINDGLVLQDGAVVGKVDGLRCFRELLHPAPGIVVSLLEGNQRVGGGSLEAELGANLGPINLEGCAALYEGIELVFMSTVVVATR